jgi:dihydroorotate dehydrogenase subfamily 2
MLRGSYLSLIALVYQYFLKPLFFLIDAEAIHQLILKFGENMGKSTLITRSLRPVFAPRYPSLSQDLSGLNFATPIGLAAGFDYQAKLTQFLPSLGFGFSTVGTITRLPYPGNPSPRLGRLPHSRSLLVNKGFKNDGALAVIRQLTSLDFGFPLGISLGKTNLPSVDTLPQAIDDITTSFRLFESSSLVHSYYELNISCPNLRSSLSFYHPPNLQVLLLALAALHLSRPVFLKMPISPPNDVILSLLEVAATFDFVKGVILGNLQTDRHCLDLDPSEISRFPVGNFSGRPTFARSNELISLAYRHYSSRFIIIGCGGVFSATDAYQKIQAGASLVQLITGLVYQGPQLVAQINLDLTRLLARDGFTHLSQAVGTRLTN